MAKKHKPRSGSLQFWPRKRAKKIVPRIKSWSNSPDTKPLAFIGYKAGMTHILIKDNRKHSQTKNESVSLPVTIIECPPLKIFSTRFYKTIDTKLKIISEVLSPNLDKELSRTISLPKKIKSTEPKPEEYDEVRILIYTQPKKTNIGKKKPDIVEVTIGGNKEGQLKFVKENIDKEISIEQVFNEIDVVDAHAVTIGKGFQGPVKRFGISLTSHKSEKARRNPGSLGPWKGQTHIMWKIAHAGQTGFHTRTEYNKQILKISPDVEEINRKGGIPHYGVVKNPYILIKGSIPGPKKRAIVLTKAIRPKINFKEKLIIEKIN